MLFYDTINQSEGIDANKTNDSKEWIICHYCYFIDKGFKFQQDVCNGCHDAFLMFMKNIAILNIQGVDYYCIISGVRKSEATNLMQNINSSEKSRKL